MISEKEGKEYLAKQFYQCPYCQRIHSIAEWERLPKELKKRKLKPLRCRLRHSQYLGSFVTKDNRVIDVFNMREKLREEGIIPEEETTYVLMLSMGEPNEVFEEIETEEEEPFEDYELFQQMDYESYYSGEEELMG